MLPGSTGLEKGKGYKENLLENFIPGVEGGRGKNLKTNKNFFPGVKKGRGEGLKTNEWGARPIIPRSWLVLATATEVLRTPAEEATASDTRLAHAQA